MIIVQKRAIMELSRGGSQMPQKGNEMKHTLLYTHDYDTDQNAVIYFGTANAKIWRTGIKSYERQSYAQKYLKGIMEETISMPEPDEIVRKEPEESHEEFEDRVAGDLEHIAEYTRIFPNNPTKALNTPTIFYKSFNTFPPSLIWYETEKEAKREADGIDTVYLGPVEVYDPDEIKKITDEIASYNG